MYRPTVLESGHRFGEFFNLMEPVAVIRRASTNLIANKRAEPKRAEPKSAPPRAPLSLTFSNELVARGQLVEGQRGDVPPLREERAAMLGKLVTRLWADKVEPVDKVRPAGGGGPLRQG